MAVIPNVPASKTSGLLPVPNDPVAWVRLIVPAVSTAPVGKVILPLPELTKVMTLVLVSDP